MKEVSEVDERDVRDVPGRVVAKLSSAEREGEGGESGGEEKEKRDLMKKRGQSKGRLLILVTPAAPRSGAGLMLAHLLQYTSATPCLCEYRGFEQPPARHYSAPQKWASHSTVACATLSGLSSRARRMALGHWTHAIHNSAEAGGAGIRGPPMACWLVWLDVLTLWTR